MLARLGSVDPSRRRLAGEVTALVALAFAVVAFSGGWLDGALVLDGPGAALWVDLVERHLDNGGFAYWVPEVWAGTPTWALAPSLPVFILVPLASTVGADTAVRLASVAGQVIGAWGTYVLARMLWGRRVPAAVAGLLYALHPVIISHSALAGHQPAVEVMGLTPWAIWSLIRAMRGDGAHFVGLAGLFVGLSVLFQPEHAYGVALLVLAVFAVELARAKSEGRGVRSWKALLVRVGAVGLVASGLLAYWALPFAELADSFVLSPPSLVRTWLVEGSGGAVGRDPGLLLGRGDELSGVTSFQSTDFLEAGGFYVSWVTLALTVVTVAVLRLKDREGYLTAILFACAMAVWLQTGGIPLSSSGLVRSASVVTFVLIGSVAGLLVGSFLHQLRFRKWAAGAGVATAAFLVLLPYVTPFLALQRIVPLLSTVRFPRLYPIVPLGVALGAAYVVVLANDWARARAPQLATLLTASTALLLVAVFVVDVHPYRSFYRARAPEAAASFARAGDALAQSGSVHRVAGSLDPRATEPILDLGRRTSTGWPHPLASRRLWRVTAEAMFVTPPGYRDGALALSATSHVVHERMATSEDAGPVIDHVELEPNPLVLPLVRAYDRALVVRDEEITPELAVTLAQRHIGVVAGGSREAEALGSAVAGVVDEPDPCTPAPPGLAGTELELSGEVAAACALHRWAGVFLRSDFVRIDRQGVGARMTATADGLRSIGVWIDQPPGPTELVLYELAEDGRTFGAEVRRTRSSGYDEMGVAAFTFEPIPDSAGRQYVFVLSCALCPEGEDPQLIISSDERVPGDLVVGGRLDTESVVSYTARYDRLPPASPTSTRLEARNTRPGEWRIRSSGASHSLLVVSEAWFPGWKATVDGQPVPVMIADGAFLGVPLGPGDHDITLSYSAPRIAVVGRLVTGASVAVALALVVAGTARSRAARNRPRPGAGAARGRAGRSGTAGARATEGTGPGRVPPSRVPPPRVTRSRPPGPDPRPGR